jgi:hypothetical protein
LASPRLVIEVIPKMIESIPIIETLIPSSSFGLLAIPGPITLISMLVNLILIKPFASGACIQGKRTSNVVVI